MDKLIMILNSNSSTYITLSNLQKLLNKSEYQLEFDCINLLIQRRIIEPVKSSGKNGRTPSLFLKYKIIKEKIDNSSYIDEIMLLHPNLNISGYRNNINTYLKHRDIVLPLSNFLRTNSVTLNKPMSRNERAYSIWKDEKALDNSLYNTVIRFNQLEEKLNYYMTPEPFFDYIHTKREKMTVLIIENKDTWFTFRKVMTEIGSKTSLLGKEIDVLLYGEGNKINKPFAVTEYKNNVLCSDAEFLYFGDLDFEGINLFLRVKEMNPDIKIDLFAPIYTHMLILAENQTVGTIKNNQKEVSEIDTFLNLFEKHDMDRIKALFDKRQYIPQEIINYQVIKDILQSAKNGDYYV